MLPWVSFASDEESRGIGWVFLKSGAHPRAYGNLAGVYARYVRDEKLLTVEEAVRRMKSLLASGGRITTAQADPGSLDEIRLNA